MVNIHITTGRLFSSGQIKNSVREMHARAAATEPINPARFNDPMSFQHFFKLVAGCIAHTGRSLESIYPICPKSVHDWFPERVAVKRYVEFLEGEVMEGDISPKVSAPILQILYFGKFDVGFDTFC